MSSCSDRPTPKETTLKASLVSSSQRYTYYCNIFTFVLLTSCVAHDSTALSLQQSFWFNYLLFFPLTLTYQANYLCTLSLSTPSHLVWVIFSHPPYTASLFNRCHSCFSRLPFCLFHLCFSLLSTITPFPLSITFHSSQQTVIPGVNVKVRPR